MKAYTDLEQSKKLAAGILPLESADMCWSIDIPDLPTLFAYPITDCDNWENKISAWSLAALLDVLPLEIETHKQTDGYKIYYYVESYMKRMGKEIYLSTERHENLVDACVEMILKLNEQKLL